VLWSAGALAPGLHAARLARSILALPSSTAAITVHSSDLLRPQRLSYPSRLLHWLCALVATSSGWPLGRAAARAPFFFLHLSLTAAAR
jgi:hypothetical protein